MIAKGVEVNGALFRPILNAVYYPDTVLTIVAATLILVLGAGLYPAWKAGQRAAHGSDTRELKRLHRT